jgi:hypothetical protein
LEEALVICGKFMENPLGLMKFDEFQLISEMTQNVAGFKNPCGGSLHSSA